MANITPSRHFIDVVAEVVRKSGGREVRIAEIGVDRGATTREVVKLLRPKDTYDLFDVEDCSLFLDRADLSAHQCEIIVHENSRKVFDSYAWSLAKLSLEMRCGGMGEGLWDAVYLDGAHTFPVDAPATCLIKEMVKKGGVLVFDDVHWSLATSPTCNTPSMKTRYTEEQMDARHVDMIIDLFVRNDSRFTERTQRDDGRAIFVRVR